MPDPNSEFNVAKDRIMAEFAAQGYGKASSIPELVVLLEHTSIPELMVMLEYVRVKGDFDFESLESGAQLNLDQVIWATLYDCLMKRIKDKLKQVEAHNKNIRELEALKEKMEAKFKASPNDYGIRVWWGFVIIGLLLGWIRSADFGPILLYGLAFWVAGMFFCIFAIDSANVQSRIAIFLHHKLHMERIAYWLYDRALTIR